MYTKPLLKNPCQGGHEMDNFSRPFHGHHYYGLILSDLCPSVEKFLKKCIFSIWLKWSCLCTRTPASKGHEIKNLGRSFLGHYYYVVSLSNLCQGVEKKISTFFLINPHHPRMLCAKFGWNWLCGPGEVLIFVDVFLPFCYYLPFKKGTTLYSFEKNWILFTQQYIVPRVVEI